MAPPDQYLHKRQLLFYFTSQFDGYDLFLASYKFFPVYRVCSRLSSLDQEKTDISAYSSGLSGTFKAMKFKNRVGLVEYKLGFTDIFILAWCRGE